MPVEKRYLLLPCVDLLLPLITQRPFALHQLFLLLIGQF